MKKSFEKILKGYQKFRDKYALGNKSIMHNLSHHGQQPEIMVVACCDSRVDPAVIFQCEPGELFVARNVANIVPPYEKDPLHHGTSAALEFGIRFLNVKHLIILGHSQCGGINALLNSETMQSENDFITSWVSLLKDETAHTHDLDTCAQQSLNRSYENCLTFPWIKERCEQKKLLIHRWFFNINEGKIYSYSENSQSYKPLDSKIPL